MAYLFRGPDRLKLKKAVQVLNAIKKRDLIAQQPTTKKSQAISTRTLMTDPTPPGTGPTLTALNTLLTALQLNLGYKR